MGNAAGTYTTMNNSWVTDMFSNDNTVRGIVEFNDIDMLKSISHIRIRPVVLDKLVYVTIKCGNSVMLGYILDKLRYPIDRMSLLEKAVGTGDCSLVKVLLDRGVNTAIPYLLCNASLGKNAVNMYKLLRGAGAKMTQTQERSAAIEIRNRLGKIREESGIEKERKKVSKRIEKAVARLLGTVPEIRRIECNAIAYSEKLDARKGLYSLSDIVNDIVRDQQDIRRYGNRKRLAYIIDFLEELLVEYRKTIDQRSSARIPPVEIYADLDFRLAKRDDVFSVFLESEYLLADLLEEYEGLMQCYKRSLQVIASSSYDLLYRCENG